MLSSIREWIIQDVVYSYPATDDPDFLKYTSKYIVLSLHHHHTQSYSYYHPLCTCHISRVDLWHH